MVGLCTGEDGGGLGRRGRSGGHIANEDYIEFGVGGDGLIDMYVTDGCENWEEIDTLKLVEIMWCQCIEV